MAQRRRRGGPQCRAHDRDRHGQRRTQTALPDRVGRDRDSHHLGPRLNGQARRRTRGHPSSGLLSDAIGGLGGASEGRGLGPSRPANGGETAEARGRIAPCGRPTKRPRSAPGVGGRRAAYGERGRRVVRAQRLLEVGVVVVGRRLRRHEREFTELDRVVPLLLPASTATTSTFSPWHSLLLPAASSDQSTSP